MDMRDDDENKSSGALAEVLLGAPGVIVADDRGPLPLIIILLDFVIASVVHPSSLGPSSFDAPTIGTSSLSSPYPLRVACLLASPPSSTSSSPMATTLGPLPPPLDMGLHPRGHQSSTLGAFRPHFTLLTQAFIPVVIILLVDLDFLIVVLPSPSGLGLHPWVLYPSHAIGGFLLGLPSVDAPHCHSATPSWLEQDMSLVARTHCFPSPLSP
ncbi:hypothetical protein BJY52DRAFT_1191924 [Lactarius psammicola]|nr:hypothetical protein BJY52DRAFT_1191924 [Lactarius psammicola]